MHLLIDSDLWFSMHELKDYLRDRSYSARLLKTLALQQLQS